MTFSRRTAQLLHEDHQQTISVVEGLERMVTKARKHPPDINEPQTRASLKNTVGAIDEEVSAHFTFEETELFTRLEDMGDMAIGQHLRGEHAAILPLGKSVVELAKEALDSEFTPESWAMFRKVAGELIERMYVHIQKEEMALLPALDDLLDDQTDMDLAMSYSENH